MKLLQHSWHFIVSEPFSWLQRYFFKINAFMNAVEIKDRATRLRLLRRLLLPMFLVSYPVSLLFALIGMAISGHFHFDFLLLLETAIGLLSGIVVGIIWDAGMNRPVGIPGGMWFGIWLGMWAAISWSAWLAILLITIGGVALGGGVVKSIGTITAKKFAENKRYLEDLPSELEGFTQWYTFFQELIGISLLYAIEGATPDLEPKQSRSIGSIVIWCIVVSVLALVASTAISLIDPQRLTWPIWWAITIGSLAGIVAGLVLSHADHPLARWGAGMGSGIVIGTMLGNFQPLAVTTSALANTPAIVTAIAWGLTLIVIYRRTARTSQMRKTKLLIFLAGMIPGFIAGHLSGNAWVIVLFPLCYIISYCQLPLSVLSFISLLSAARASRQTDPAYAYPYSSSYYIQDADDDDYLQDADENSSEVFTHLRASSLYWDEWEILPIPDLEDFNANWYGLNYMMKLAFKENIEKATDILTFIESERPLHFIGVQAGIQANDLPFTYRERRNPEVEVDLSEYVRHFTLLQAPVLKLHLSDSYQWLALLENVIESVIEKDIEQAVEIIARVESQQASEVATEPSDKRPIAQARSYRVHRRPWTPRTAIENGLCSGFLKLAADERLLRDLPETIQQFGHLQALASKFDLSDSQEWCRLLENIVALVAEQDMEQAVKIIALVESEQPAQVETEPAQEHDSEAEDELYNPLPPDYPRAPRPTGTRRYPPPPVARPGAPRRPPPRAPRPPVARPGAPRRPPPRAPGPPVARPGAPRRPPPPVRSAVRLSPYPETRVYSPLTAARTGLYRGFVKRIAHELEQQKTLRDISEAPPQITALQALATRLNISGLNYLFVHAHDVCLDAVHYRNSLGWQARHDALEHMITKLKNMKDSADPSMQSVIDVLDRWGSTAQYELDKLQQEPRRTDQINNPYIVGQALQPGTSLFVGRGDLVQQLEQGLGRGGHRPTFFLNGERRMGKSSTLRQLPILLDKRHFLPILFDLQAPEITYNIASFLGSVAERMREVLENAGMQIEALESGRLQEAQRESEGAVYYTFNEWLKEAEHVLEQHGRVVLLSFDEFENLELVGKAKSLDLHLLLNWFRSVIQNRPQLALLFSGGKSVSEMGQETGLNWS
ncbi:MAG: hypothetical protein M3Z08_10170, partial [Chloroflexota bacterium]|nr:hypothetical protein [Chloroflexota bacterium]